MNYLILIPVSLGMGFAGLCAFLWALRHDQFSDLDGAAWRVVLNDRQGPPEPHQPVAGNRRPLPAEERRRASPPDRT